MGVHILHDEKGAQAALYCSTSDVAFGPVFGASSEHGKDAEERAQAFLRWLDLPEQAAIRAKAMGNDFFSTGRFDVRMMDGREIQLAYSSWLCQEAEQYQREETPEPEEV